VTQQLPTQAQIFAAALAHLDASRLEASEARDWLKSDWAPPGTPLTDRGAAARSATLRRIGDIKDLIDQATNELHEALADLSALPAGGSVLVDSVISDRVDADEHTTPAADSVEDFLSRRPSEAERAARRIDLVARAEAVRRHGWDDYRYTWSSGEVAGVAYLLGDTTVLAELNETDETALRRYAYDLYGNSGGREDTAAGLTRTRDWFATARAELHSGPAGGATP
jgi:YD repeat-containing protein